MTDLSDYVSGGYYITRYIDRPKYCADFLPDNLLSMSSCFCSFFPDVWAIEWCSVSPENRAASASLFGIPVGDISQIVDHVTTLFDVEYDFPNVCRSLEVAQKFTSELSRYSSDLIVLGVGLPEPFVGEFIEKAGAPAQQPGHAPVGETGIYQAVRRAEPLEPSGEILGHEPLVYNHGLSCSWLCNGLEQACQKELGISPNSHGVIEKTDDAVHCVEYVSREDVGAEPGLWLPWLLVKYV